MYYVYMLRCENGSIYTGITTEPERRFREHAGVRAGGAKATAMHRPVKFEAIWAADDRAAASRLEYRIKRLTRAQKERLVAGDAPETLSLDARRRLRITDTGRILTMMFVCYPKCSTCKKAQALLDARSADYVLRDIKIENPTAEELRAWHAKSGLPLKRFFNTSGMLYRELGLGEKLAGMSEEEQYALLATDGMLVRRPLVITENRVLVGFRAAEWEALLDEMDGAAE